MERPQNTSRRHYIQITPKQKQLSLLDKRESAIANEQLSLLDKRDEEQSDGGSWKI